MQKEEKRICRRTGAGITHNKDHHLFSKVVFPEPRKPVKTVTGTGPEFSWFSCTSFSFPSLVSSPKPTIRGLEFGVTLCWDIPWNWEEANAEGWCEKILVCEGEKERIELKMAGRDLDGIQQEADVRNRRARSRRRPPEFRLRAAGIGNLLL
jgi:hypothetical protein